MTREEAIKIIKSATVYTPKETEALETLIPELRESEDERVRKAILGLTYLDGIKPILTKCSITAGDIRAYLEKQKEQIPYIDFVIKPHKGDDNNPYDMRVSEAQEYAIKRGFGIPFNDGEVYVDERHLTQTIGNILRWADEHPKEQEPWKVGANAYFTPEQKPTEWSEYKSVSDKLYEILDQTRLWDKYKPADEIEQYAQKQAHIICQIYERERRNNAPFFNVKNTDFSETENKVWDLFLDTFFWKEDDGSYTSVSLSDEEAKDFLAKLFAIVKFENSVEWSEEDERILKGIIGLIDHDQHYGVGNKEMISWLKSLRPQPKREVPADTEVLTAKLVNLLKSYRIGEETATDLANRIADTYGTQRYLDGLCDGKKGEWKPSEEQMEALNYAIAEWDGGKRLEGLYALRNDLKKLGVKEEPEYYQHFDPDC